MANMQYNKSAQVNVSYFITKNNSCPVMDFIESIDNKKLRSKIINTIDLLETCGHLLPYPYSKYLGHGLYELRIKHGSMIARIFYFYRKPDSVVLTNGFIKKTNKTPVNELSRALQYKSQYKKGEPK